VEETIVTRRLTVLIGLVVSAGTVYGQNYSWRYYRPGNTGIQGDFNGAMWIGADGDPWIGGYDPSFEEGGVAKFLQSENRWINISNVDYPVIGHPDDTGTTRVSDIIADDQGNLWMGTWRGLLRFNPALGPASLVKYGPGNSALPGGRTMDVARAPDGSIWVSATSVIWGDGGLTRYVPATNTWTHFAGRGGGMIAAQPKPGGGYYLWTTLGGFSSAERWDSTTQAWTTYPVVSGAPALLTSLDSADDAGNVWMMRWTGVQGEQTLDCIRPDGTWITPPLPPPHPQVPVAALRAFGNMQALLVDGYAHLHRFNGASWADLGPVPHNGTIDDLDIDAAGNIWLCGSGQGGALRRDSGTGQWQRYRVTNTSQFESFNNDLAVDPANGDVYACANAGSGVGGMVKFDGVRWTGFNNFTYGLGVAWPFPTDNSEAVYVRPSTGRVAVNPTNNFTHELSATTWTPLPGGPDQVQQYAEDSLGRLWGAAHYGGIGIFQNGGFTTVSPGVMFNTVQRDPSRAGTVWANLGEEMLRTDGVYRFSRTIQEIPELAAVGGSFTGLAAAPNGVAWVGTWTQFTSTGSALLRFDANAGTYQIWQHDAGWPFPGEHVRPLAVTPDGRVWMLYDSEYPSTESGLLWWDGVNLGTFPAPPGGVPQWGGLPHAGIKDLEVKLIPGGYELWMSCLSRGIAVLTVAGAPPCYANCDGSTTAPVLNVNDFICFLGRFAAGEAYANCDGSTVAPVLNINDFVCFQGRFAAGCR
jgi:hypothetical protein